MKLRLADKSTFAAPLDDWPLPLEMSYVASRELALLKRDLDRYAKGQVRGRSYLIGGHRGAGKSALVQRAAELLAAETMRESVKENGALDAGPIQRPLLVKLHGPSMLEVQPTGVRPPAKDQSAAESAGSQEGTGTDQTSAPKDPVAEGKQTAPDPAGGPPVTPGTHAALVQITIGLYRALAGEAATGYRAHARRAAERLRSGDFTELATQLALDLDSGAPPARLRSYWSGLGRLAKGVLWPNSADATLDAHGMGDQGLRELVALATAAQAFQVCTGRISYSETAKDHLVREQAAEIKGSSNL